MVSPSFTVAAPKLLSCIAMRSHLDGYQVFGNQYMPTWHRHLGSSSKWVQPCICSIEKISLFLPLNYAGMRYFRAELLFSDAFFASLIRSRALLASITFGFSQWLLFPTIITHSTFHLDRINLCSCQENWAIKKLLPPIKTLHFTNFDNFLRTLHQ